MSNLSKTNIRMRYNRYKLSLNGKLIRPIDFRIASRLSRKSLEKPRRIAKWGLTRLERGPLDFSPDPRNKRAANDSSRPGRS
jgi:hypothetical protein